jgi:diaminopimelate epimerase
MATRKFYKMSGSGNDFVVFDAREVAVGALEDSVVIQALCARGTGVGADGVVFMEPPGEEEEEEHGASFRMRYFNADGSAGAMCGNAALCMTRLAAYLGVAEPEEMRFQTDTGILNARIAGALPEVDLQPAQEVRPDIDLQKQPRERRIGYVLMGVPHVVVLCDDVDGIDVIERGRAIRMDPSLRPDGANVNFVASRADGTWAIRTYERGVEGETLACGTGAISSAILLNSWGASGAETTFTTRSDRPVVVRLARDGGLWRPTLRGQGRLVFTGELADR